MEMTDVRVTPVALSDIHQNEADYLWDEAKKRKKVMVYVTLVVDLETLEVGPTPPTPTVAPTTDTSGTTSTSTGPSPSTIPQAISRPPLI